MACETSCCVLTRGEFFIADWVKTCPPGTVDPLCSLPKPFKKLGNVSSCAIANQVEVLGKENQFNPIDSTCARVSIQGVNITLTLNCASKENLYRALYGIKIVPDAGTHTKEYCITSLSECDFFPFEKHEVDLDAVSVVLRLANGSVLSTLVKNVDYSLSVSGIEILRSDINIAGAVSVSLTYDYDNANSFEVNYLSQYQGYKTLYFKGTNYADGSEAMFDAYFHKVLFAPIGEFDLITADEFFTITLTGSVEKDNGSWYKITKKE